MKNTETFSETFTVVVETTHELPIHTIPDRLKYALSWMDDLKGVTVSKIDAGRDEG
jgi:hypothetical protein